MTCCPQHVTPSDSRTLPTTSGYLALGGQETADNLVVACSACVSRKGKTAAAQFVLDRIPQVELELAILVALRDRDTGVIRDV